MKPQEFSGAGAPAAGTDGVQTLTIGGTPSGGWIKLKQRGLVTGQIAWSSTNNTFRDNIDAALEALPLIGAGGVTTAVGTMTSGVGTMTMTGAGKRGKRAMPAITVAENGLTGTSPTAGMAVTTPGVPAFGVGKAKAGDRYTDTTNGKAYIVSAVTNGVPTWTVIGTQT